MQIDGLDGGESEGEPVQRAVRCGVPSRTTATLLDKGGREGGKSEQLICGRKERAAVRVAAVAAPEEREPDPLGPCASWHFPPSVPR